MENEIPTKDEQSGITSSVEKPPDTEEPLEKDKQNEPPTAKSSLNPSKHASSTKPQVVYTPADPSIPIPAGRIVDDSTRGTLFWEVFEKDLVEEEGDTSDSERQDTTALESTDDGNWTTPFKIKWLSPQGKRLPFSRVRSLRNSFNKNRFLKNARDGTEVDPLVGRKVIDMFHQV